MHVKENGTNWQASQLIIYSNLPITCQSIWGGRPQYCSLKFIISSDTSDVAMRVLDGRQKYCEYHLYDRDWKPNEKFAYNSSRLLQFVARV